MCAFVTVILRTRLLRLVPVMALGIILPLTVSAAEFTRFKLTGYRAFLTTLMRYDESTTETVGGTSKDVTPLSRRELGGSAFGYFYHPNLVTFSTNGSLLFEQRRFERNDSETEDSGIAWNINTRLNFLRNKPYPFSVFFDRAHPLIFVGTAESFEQKQTRFGLDFSLLEPFSPVTVTASLSRNMQEGESISFQQDDISDNFHIDLQHAFFGEEHSQLSYNIVRSETRSGSQNLTIQSNESITQHINFSNRWRLGDRGQFRLSNEANYNLSDTPDRQRFNYKPRLTWYQTGNMRSEFRYDFRMVTQGREFGDDLESFNNSGSARLHLRLSKRLAGAVGVRGSRNDNDTSTNQSYGAFTRAQYQQPTPVGNLAVSGGVAYDFNSQETTTPQGEEINENLTLSGTGFPNRVPLANDFVVAGSVVVINAVNLDPCIEGVDYTLHVVGTQTLIELPFGALTTGCFALTPDPERVLVDYSFETGGSFDFSSLSSNISTNLTIARNYNLFASISDRRQTEHDSTLTLSRQLRSTTTTAVGARANGISLWWNIRAGGEAIYRYQTEDVSSRDETRLGAHISVPLPWRTLANFSVIRSMVGLSDSDEDSDITRYSARIASSPWRRLGLTADASYEEDSGSTFKTSRTNANFRATWQIRKLRLSAVAKYEESTRGDFVRNRLEAWLLIRRDIW